jgi:hypothetical protein
VDAWKCAPGSVSFVERDDLLLSVCLRPLDVGLLPAYGTRNEVVRTYLRGEAKFLPAQIRPSRLRAVARLLGRRREDRYFRKVAGWEPPEG